jgi:hypothetical protein
LYFSFKKKKDKVEGTGRFHIMKNRYGMDGLTFGVKADTSTGHFEVLMIIMKMKMILIITPILKQIVLWNR